MPIRALWVEAEGEYSPFLSNRNLSSFQHNLDKLGIRRIYLQVFRRGYAWFPTPHSDTAPAALENPLQAIQDLCADQGIELYAWVNAFNGGQLPGPKFLQLLEGGELQDNFGRSTGYYLGLPSSPLFELDTPGRWLEPSYAPAREYLRLIISDLAAHKGLAGIHLDFIRYPYAIPIRPYSGTPTGIDFGYSRLSQLEKEELFISGAAGALYPRDEARSLTWDRMRRHSISSFVSEIKNLLGALSLSCAVLAWPDRAYLNAFQDWRSWLRERVCDEIALMSYTGDTELLRLLVRQAVAFRSSGTAVLAGVGVYKLKNAGEIADQIETVDAEKADGTVLFSYNNLMKNPEIARELFK